MQKSKADIYTAMLGLSLLAIILAIIFMLIEMAAYNWDYKARAAGGISYAPPAAIEQAERFAVGPGGALGAAGRGARPSTTRAADSRAIA